jgi:hypothetical protein
MQDTLNKRKALLKKSRERAEKTKDVFVKGLNASVRSEKK